jgi:peptidoglycan/LPS O-acetylase OafA/YrhL
MHTYFSSHVSLSYLANIVAMPHYGLPGVFERNPRHGVVNGSLWTIQVEIAAYFLLAGIAAIGGLRFPRAFGLAVAFVTLAVPLSILGDTFHYFAWIPAPELCVFFFAGAALCLLSDRIPLRSKAALAGLGISLLLIPNATWSCLGALPVAYFTLWIARHCQRWRFIQGDYSYGLYLVGYPLEQIYIRLFPMTHNWWITAMGALPVASLCAAGLWHFVEWPILRRKHEVIRRFCAGERLRKSQPPFSAQTPEQIWVRPLPTAVAGETPG